MGVSGDYLPRFSFFAARFSMRVLAGFFLLSFLVSLALLIYFAPLVNSTRIYSLVMPRACQCKISNGTCRMVDYSVSHPRVSLKEQIMKSKIQSQALVEALRTLLKNRAASSQEELCSALEAQQFDVNQSKISRLLRKLKALKIENEHGQVVYSLPQEPAPPMASYLATLVLDIIANETLVVVYTSPGSASLVARLLDYNQRSTEILATVAGDDTIFVAPKSIKRINKLEQEVRKLLTPSK